MTLIGLDPDATRTLATTMQLAAEASDALIGDVNAALLLSELDSEVPRQLTMESVELEKVGLVLHARVDVIEGYVIDVEKLAEQLDIPAAQITAAVETVSNDDFDETTDPLLTLVASQHYLFDNPPDTIRQALIGLPPIGQDTALDQAIDRVGDLLLESLFDDRRLDHDDLSDQQSSDMKLIAIALGADQLTETRKKVTEHRRGPDDYELRTTVVEIPIVDLGRDDILDFVQTQVEQDAGRRKATNELIQATATIDRDNLDAEAEKLGVTTEELQVVLAATDVVAADNNGKTRSVTNPADAEIDISFPDRKDFPAGVQGDESYLQAVEENRLDKVNAGLNVVGPAENEQDALYSAMGSLFGAQHFAFSHDYQATLAELQNQRDPGFLGVDIPNAITATVGYAAAVVTGPVVGLMNTVFGTKIDVAVVGTAIADITWSAFGYDVHAPTIASSQAARKAREKAREEFEKLSEKEKQKVRDDFDSSSDRRDNLAKEGHDPSIRDDDFSGDQNTGGNGLL